MKEPKMSDKQKIECTVIKVLDEKETRRGITRIQVVRWGTYSPQLEKREYYTDAEGQEKMGKAKGFNFDDFSLIVDKAEEIDKLMDKN